ncbi:MAG: hypothetical protein RJA61_179 [Candidatus Parcubacteria bacterium]|jgi:hypothetical protein
MEFIEMIDNDNFVQGQILSIDTQDDLWIIRGAIKKIKVSNNRLTIDTLWTARYLPHTNQWCKLTTAPNVSRSGKKFIIENTDQCSLVYFDRGVWKITGNKPTFFIVTRDSKGNSLKEEDLIML